MTFKLSSLNGLFFGHPAVSDSIIALGSAVATGGCTINNNDDNSKKRITISLRYQGLPGLVWVIYSIWEKGSQHLQLKILFILYAISPTLNYPNLVV